MKKIKALLVSLLSLSVVGALSGCSFDALLGGSSDSSTPTNSESSTPDASTPDASTPDESTPDESTPDESTPDDGGDVVDPTPEGPATPVSGDGSEYDPYVIEAGKTYVASNYHATDEFDMDIWTNNYVITSAVNGTYTFNLLEDLNEYDVEVQIQGVTIPLDEENDYKQMADGFSFSVAAGVEVKFTVSSASWDSYPATYYDVNFSVDFDANTYEADGSQLAPITLENGATYTVGESNVYYNFTAPSAGYYKLTVNADWAVVTEEYEGFNFYDADYNSFLRGVAVEIAEGETISFYAANYICDDAWQNIPTSWTFSFGEALENDENYDVPVIEEEAVVGTMDNPHMIYMAWDYEITVSANDFYYICLNDVLQFVVPEGFSAKTMGMNRVEYAAGETVAFTDYHPMMNSQLLVMLYNAGESDVTLTLSVSDYIAEEGGNGDAIANGSIEVTTTDNYTMYDVDSYTFTAPVAGKYVFNIPGGLGLWSDEAMTSNPYGAPEVDYYDNQNGATVEVELAAGAEYKFWLNCMVKGDYVISWNAYEAEVEGGEEEVINTVLAVGANALVFSADNYTTGIEYTFTADIAGAYEFGTGGALMFQVLKDGIQIGSHRTGPVNMEAGVTYTVLVSAPMGAGNYTLTITAPTVEVEEEDYVLEVGANKVTITEENVNLENALGYTFTPAEAGLYQFRGDLMCVVYDEAFNEMTKTSGKYTLNAGVEYFVAIYNMMPSFFKPGDYTITINFEAIVVETPSESTVFPVDYTVAYPGGGQSTLVKYEISVASAGTLVLTFDITDTWVIINSSTAQVAYIYNKDTYEVELPASGTYTIAVGTWSEVETTFNMNLAFNAA